MLGTVPHPSPTQNRQQPFIEKPLPARPDPTHVDMPAESSAPWHASGVSNSSHYFTPPDPLSVQPGLSNTEPAERSQSTIDPASRLPPNPSPTSLGVPSTGFLGLLHGHSEVDDEIARIIPIVRKRMLAGLPPYPENHTSKFM